jgi:hypothetical protein
MSWFENLTGVAETSPQQVRAQLKLEGDELVCPNGQRIACGTLEIPTLGELRSRARSATIPGKLSVRQFVGDVRQLHADPQHAGALFQVASQFNLLEMTSPTVTPEEGVGIYEHDPTQGPACAIACGGGTIYRNYFVPLGEAAGQSTERQIDAAADLGALLGNGTGALWRMQNGYLLPMATGLQQVNEQLRRADEAQRDRYRASLRIGLQWNTAVTLAGAAHRVSQAYCSAVPVAYSRYRAEQWEPLARLVLEAAYEAVLCAAVINAAEYGCRQLFLTLLGGGVFGNHDCWITDAIARALTLHRDQRLEVAIVSYKSPKPAVTALLERLQ